MKRETYGFTVNYIEWVKWIEDIANKHPFYDFMDHLDKHLHEDDPDPDTTYNLIALILKKAGVNPLQILKWLNDYTGPVDAFERKVSFACLHC